jgi:hypothetical protein
MLAKDKANGAALRAKDKAAVVFKKPRLDWLLSNI